MLAEAVSHIHDEGFRAEHYFGTHPNPDISRYAVNLANERYTLSKYHTLRTGSPRDDRLQACHRGGGTEAYPTSPARPGEHARREPVPVHHEALQGPVRGTAYHGKATR